YRLSRARRQTRPPRRAQGAPPRAGRSPRRRAVPARDPSHGTTPASAYPDTDRFGGGRWLPLLRDAVRRGGEPAPASGTGRPAAARRGPAPYRRDRLAPRLRAPPPCHPSRYQAREYHAPPAPAAGGGPQ